MKKASIIKSTLLGMFFAFICIIGNAQGNVLSEDFSNIVDSNTTNIYNNLDSYLQQPGWTGNKVYPSNGKVRIGTSSAQGWIQTPSLDLSNDGGVFILEFDAAAWKNDATSLKVYVNDTEYIVEGMNNSGDNIIFNHFSLQLPGGTSNTSIKFSGKQTSKSRFFLDNVSIEQMVGNMRAAMPTFSLTPGLYTEPISLTLSCTTPDATIYYTTDGTSPDINSTEYTSPITISQTTTVKAKAYAVGLNPSFEATATYSFPNIYQNIAAFKSAYTASSNQPCFISNDITFVYQANTGSQTYTYVKDETAGLLVFENNPFIITNTYDEGDVISGGLNGTFSLYNGQIELIPTANPAPASYNDGTVTPVEITIADLINDYAQYDAQLITLRNVTLGGDLSYTTGATGSAVNVSQGNNSVAVYNRFKTLDTTIANGSVTDITGFVGIYNSNIQIYPRYNADLIAADEPVPQPALSIVSPADGTVFSTLDTLLVELDIQNFVLGTDGLLMIESNILPMVNLPNPSYFDATAWNAFQYLVLSPLPAGEFSATVTLVDMNQVPLSPIISATTDFSVIAPVLPTPAITVSGDATGAADTYFFSANVTISEAQNGASVYYTTDGTTPTSASNLYSAPFDVTNSCTVKAIAMMDNYANSDIATATVNIEIPTVATPVFTPNTGTYADSVEFSLLCSTEGAEIRYTTDGSEPTSASTLYAVPVVLNSTTTVKAKAFKADWNASETATATYTIAHEPALAVTPNALSFSSTALTNSFEITSAFLTAPIAISSDNTHFTLSESSIPATTASATITVTFDGSMPTTGTITVSSDTLSAVIALAATAKLATPVITPATGTIDTAITVAIASTNDANIYYTLDGTTPTTASTLYNVPFTLNEEGSYTVTAIAIADGWENSDIASATYTIFVPEPDYNDTIIYQTGFEASESFENGNDYQNDDIIFTGATGHQWGTVHGTPSVNDALCGEQSMQMRYYTNAQHGGHIGYTFTNFDLNDVTRVTFKAKSTNNLNMIVSYSTDGGDTYVGADTIELTSQARNYTYLVSETGENAFVRLRFTMELPTPAPTSTSKLFLDSVVVYGIPGIEHHIVETPVISPNGGQVYEPTTVTITCATDDAEIYYTTDGTTPTQNSTLYTAPFTLNSTTTVKAKAFKTNDLPSLIATATYSFPVEVADIAAFKAANSSTNTTIYKIAGDVTFVYRNGKNIYIQDASAGLLVYDQSSIITTEYTEGDVISGGVCGTYTLYNGLPELVPVRNLAPSTNNTGNIAPIVATVEDIESFYNQYESRLVKLEGVIFPNGGTFTTNAASNMDITQYGEPMQVRNNFKTLDITIPAGYEADVIGFVQIFSNASGTDYQILPRDNNDIIGNEAVATPTFTVEKLTNNMYAVTISCETEGATIYYTLDGSTPDASSTEYTGMVAVEGGMTIKAIAMKEGMSNSAVAVYENVGIHNYTDIQFDIYPNPTADKVTLHNTQYMMNNIDIFDIYGNLIQTIGVGNTSATIDLSSYATGTYMLRVNTPNGSATVKVTKR